jgi:hypothetical protein
MLPLSSSTPLERPYRPVGDSWYAPEVFEQRLLTLTDAGRHCPSVFSCRALDAEGNSGKEGTTHHFNPNEWQDAHQSCDMNRNYRVSSDALRERSFPPGRGP